MNKPELTTEKTYTEESDKQIMEKISDSLELYGGLNNHLTTVAEVYHCIKNFNFDLKDFSVSLNYVKKDHRPLGFAKFGENIFLDSVFAFTVHYKNKHVMNIGFSVTGKREILISQVQATKKKGNRFLFKIPNRVEHVLDLFFKYFPGFDIYLLNGKAFADKELEEKKSYIKNAEDILEGQLKRKNIMQEESEKKLDEEIHSTKLLIGKLETDLKEFKDHGYNHVIDVYHSTLGNYKTTKEESTYYNTSYYKVIPGNT